MKSDDLSTVDNSLFISHGDILIRCLLINVLEDGLEIGYLTGGQVDHCGPFLASDMLRYRIDQARVRFCAWFRNDETSGDPPNRLTTN